MSRTLFYSAITNEELSVLLDDMGCELEEIVVEENQEENEADLSFSCSLDNLWDGLHFLLTGFSCMDFIPVSELNRGEAVVLEELNKNLFSVAIRGRHIISNEEEYMACILHHELPEIVMMLKDVGIKLFEESFHSGVFKDVDVYSLKGDMDDTFTFSLLKEKLMELISFYEQVCENKLNVMVVTL